MSDLGPDTDPLAVFGAWLGDAETSEPNDPNAMAVVTVDDLGFPAARMCLLKGFDEQGFVFYTNLTSAKGQQLRKDPRCTLLFHWKSQRRQVRVAGRAAQVSDAEADAYFKTRARISQLGAWASKQSQPLAGRFELEARVAKVTARYAVGEVPRPPFWSGFRVAPHSIELWEDRPFRLHMRWRFARGDAGWQGTELFP
jgi:pyridoxamine 5'-phosphate oxidase